METAIQREFKYERIEDAPVRHREIGRYAATGEMSVAQMSYASGLSENSVRRILRDPIVQDYITGLQARVQAERYGYLSEFDNLVKLALKRHSDILNDDEVSPAVLMQAINAVYDRNHAGLFHKQTKHEEHHTVDVFDNRGLEDLKKRAHENGLIIDTTAEALPEPDDDDGDRATDLYADQ